MATVAQAAEVVVVEYADLQRGADLAGPIQAAFGNGPECLGIVLVRGVPGYSELRQRLLPQASAFAALPEEVRAKYERPEAVYSFGWSHGKEMFNGKPDIAKGSYYNNPTHDRPTEDPALMARFPAYCMPNVWPEGGDCPDLEPAFKALGQLIVDVGALVGNQIDRYAAAAVSGYPTHYLGGVIRTSLDCKARLLHYFPRASGADSAEGAEPDSWCGWHLDHGALTGLTGAMYMDGSRQEVPCPDARAGLYIRSRAGVLVRAVIPAGCLAFQLGQQMQVASGGALRATWHCVQAAEGPDAVGVARNTFAVFMQPNWDAILHAPPAASKADVDVAEWVPGQTFADFTVEVLRKYYTPA